MTSAEGFHACTDTTFSCASNSVPRHANGGYTPPGIEARLAIPLPADFRSLREGADRLAPGLRSFGYTFEVAPHES